MSEVITLLQDLVCIPSINPASARTGELAGEGQLANFVEQWLREAGVPVRRQAVHPGRDNILAVLPSARPGLLLEAHLDTVGSADMTGEPFGGEYSQGKVWGRGACDDKASVAAMLIAVRRVASERRQRQAGRLSHREQGGLTLALVVDEEHGFTGIVRLLAEPLPQPVLGAVAGEPTGLDVIDRHGGSVRLRFTVRGRAVHSAYPETGDNAIYHALRLVEAFEVHHQKLQANRAPEAGARTCTVTLIEGGEAINIIPSRCAVSLDRRLVPGETPGQVRAELEALAAETARGRFGYETEVILLDPPLNPRAPAPLAEMCLLTVQEVTGQGQRRGVNYSTDASNLAEAGLEAVVLGPGDITQAHSAEEWVAAEQVEQAAEIYYRLATEAPGV